MKDEKSFLGLENHILSGRVSGFTDREKGVLDNYTAEFINNGKCSVDIGFGGGKRILDPVIALRASEIAENHGLVGVYIVCYLLWGRSDPISREDAMSAYFALQNFRKEFMKKMKGGK